MVLEFLLVIGLLMDAFIWNRMFKSQYGFLSHHFFHLMPCLVSCVGSDISFFYVTILGDTKSVEDMRKLLVLLKLTTTYFLLKFAAESCLVHFTHWACFLLADMVHKEKASVIINYVPYRYGFCLPCTPPQVFYFLFSWSLKIIICLSVVAFFFVLLIV